MNVLAVAVLAGGGRGVVAVWENVARDAVVRKANASPVAAQEMLPLAVALREAFLVAVAAQEVVARAEAVQEVLARLVPLQEVVAHVVAVQEVLACSVDGWWVNGAPGDRGKAGGVISTTANRGARVCARHQGPCISLLPQFRRTATCVAYAARRAVWATQRGAEGARTLPQSTASGKPDNLHSGGGGVRH